MFFEVTKFQRHPTDSETTILHIEGSGYEPGHTFDVKDQAYRDALETAGKLED